MTDARPSPATRLALDTDMTIYHAADLKRQLIDTVHCPAPLELDLSRVGEMDTAGFQLLVLAKRESQRLGRPLRIVAHSEAVRDVIDFCNMAGYFGDPLVLPAGDGA